MVRDALVAIDAGQSGLYSRHHALLRRFGHPLNVHSAYGVTIAAFGRFGLLHGRPHTLGKLLAMLLEFFWRIDGSQDLVKDLVAGLNLAPHLGEPFMRHVTVGAGRAHAERILVVNALSIFPVYCIAHLVTGDAEWHGISLLHRPIEAAPRQDAPHAAEDYYCRQRAPPTRAPQHRPQTHDV